MKNERGLRVWVKLDGGPALPKDAAWLKKKREEGFVIFPGLPNGSGFNQGAHQPCAAGSCFLVLALARVCFAFVFFVAF